MGIQDRDYMKRKPGDAPSRDPSVEGRLDQLATNLLGKHRRFMLGVVIGIGALILIGLIMSLV